MLGVGFAVVWSALLKEENRMPDVAKGLAGVVIEETCVSEVVQEGRLRYRGYEIEDLVAYPLAEVAGLVVDGSLSADTRSVPHPTSREYPVRASRWSWPLPRIPARPAVVGIRK